jgi:predicted metal-dependent hydrolase
MSFFSRHSERKETILLEGISIDIVRTRVKNVNMRVYPLEGRVRVSAPSYIRIDELTKKLQTRLPWIRKKLSVTLTEQRVEKTYTTGERHFVAGTSCHLKVYNRHDDITVDMKDDNSIHMYVPLDADARVREKILYKWYRLHLKKRVPDFIEKCENKVGVKISEWRVKKMKTRWGTCNINAKRIWLNIELAKVSDQCLEYIIVHELVHLLERKHTPRFYSYMDSFFPEWRTCKEEIASYTK